MIAINSELRIKTKDCNRSIAYSPEVALQLAAFASGRQLEFRTLDGAPELLVPYDKQENIRWNPLEFKGDAFSLALKLKMVVRVGQVQCAAVEIWEIAPVLGDPELETQLVITRAAALIGLTMISEAQFHSLSTTGWLEA